MISPVVMYFRNITVPEHAEYEIKIHDLFGVNYDIINSYRNLSISKVLITTKLICRYGAQRNNGPEQRLVLQFNFYLTQTLVSQAYFSIYFRIQLHNQL